MNDPTELVENPKSIIYIYLDPFAFQGEQEALFLQNEFFLIRTGRNDLAFFKKRRLVLLSKLFFLDIDWGIKDQNEGDFVRNQSYFCVFLHLKGLQKEENMHWLYKLFRPCRVW